MREERAPGDPTKDTACGLRIGDGVDLPDVDLPEYSGSERHSNVGKTLPKLDTAISISLLSLPLLAFWGR
jgi:hypothetical protein